MRFINDKPAAYRVIGLAKQRKVSGKGGQRHAVFMQRQVFAAENHTAFAGKRDFMRARQR